MLRFVSRRLTAAASALFAALGAVLFVAPGWAADEFPWRVSPFLAMTMGGWYLGSALFAYESARRWRWSDGAGVLVCTWLFSVGQAALLVIHEDVLQMSRALAWPYVGVLAVAALASLAGAAALVPSRGAGERSPWSARLAAAVFALAVAMLALPLVDGYDTPRSIWPGELTLISARGFVVFFGALAVSAALLAVSGRLEPFVGYARAGIPLAAVILVAALVYVGQFDVADHPGQLLYIGLYAFVLVGSVVLLVLVRGREALAPSAFWRPEAAPRPR